MFDFDVITGPTPAQAKPLPEQVKPKPPASSASGDQVGRAPAPPTGEEGEGTGPGRRRT
jgi:hypothetical protein